MLFVRESICRPDDVQMSSRHLFPTFDPSAIAYIPIKPYLQTSIRALSDGEPPKENLRKRISVASDDKWGVRPLLAIADTLSTGVTNGKVAVGPTHLTWPNLTSAVYTRKPPFKVFRRVIPHTHGSAHGLMDPTCSGICQTAPCEVSEKTPSREWEVFNSSHCSPGLGLKHSLSCHTSCFQAESELYFQHQLSSARMRWQVSSTTGTSATRNPLVSPPVTRPT